MQGVHEDTALLCRDGLLLPNEVNPETGYRYYSIDQLETMLLINRLKSYEFSLEEIGEILRSEEEQEAKLYIALSRKAKRSGIRAEN